MLMLTPVMRVIARMDTPSTSIETTCARCAVDNLFMRVVVPHEQLQVKHKRQFVIVLLALDRQRI